MHEVAIADQILKTALPALKNGGGVRILEIRMRIGALSGVVPDLLEKAIAELAAGTPAEGAVLAVTNIPPLLRCLECGKESEGRRGHYTCPACGSDRIRLIGGSGYFLDDLLVE